MSRIIAQALLSLFVSLGVIVGVNSDVRGEAGMVWQEAKAAVHQGVDLVTDTAGNLTSQVTLNAGAEAKVGSDSEAFVDQTSSEAQTGVEADIHVDTSADAGSEGGFLMNFGSDTDTGFEIDLGFWK